MRMSGCRKGFKVWLANYYTQGDRFAAYRWRSYLYTCIYKRVYSCIFGGSTASDVCTIVVLCVITYCMSGFNYSNFILLIKLPIPST